MYRCTMCRNSALTNRCNYLVCSTPLLRLWALLALRDLNRKRYTMLEVNCSSSNVGTYCGTTSCIWCRVSSIKRIGLFSLLWLNWLRYATTYGHVTPTLVTIVVTTPGQRQTTDTINVTCVSVMIDVDTNRVWVAVEPTVYKLVTNKNNTVRNS